MTSNKLIVPKPAIIILDIYGTMTSIGFMNDLRKIAIENLEKYLEKKWKDRRLQRLLDRLYKESETLETDSDYKALIPILNNDVSAVIKSIVGHIAWRQSSKQESESVVFLCEGVWESGYEDGTIKVHIFDDVPEALELWRFQLFIKVYTVATGKRKGQHLFFKSTCHGDLTRFIANYMDCSAFGKQDPRTYENILYALREKPHNLLFLTDNPSEAIAAQEVGLQVILVIRTGNQPLSEEHMKKFRTIKSFLDIEFKEVENKQNEGSCC